jgi:hypothetical protein
LERAKYVDLLHQFPELLHVHEYRIADRVFNLVQAVSMAQACLIRDRVHSISLGEGNIAIVQQIVLSDFMKWP